MRDGNDRSNNNTTTTSNNNNKESAMGADYSNNAVSIIYAYAIINLIYSQRD